MMQVELRITEQGHDALDLRIGPLAGTQPNTRSKGATRQARYLSTFPPDRRVSGKGDSTGLSQTIRIGFSIKRGHNGSGCMEEIGCAGLSLHEFAEEWKMGSTSPRFAKFPRCMRHGSHRSYRSHGTLATQEGTRRHRVVPPRPICDNSPSSLEEKQRMHDADVIVLGLGVMGTAAAWQLAAARPVPLAWSALPSTMRRAAHMATRGSFARRITNIPPMYRLSAGPTRAGSISNSCAAASAHRLSLPDAGPARGGTGRRRPPLRGRAYAAHRGAFSR